MSYLVKSNGLQMVVDEYSIGCAPKDRNYRYINLFVSELNIRSVNVEEMFTNIQDGIELYEVGMDPAKFPDEPYFTKIDIPKFTDDFTMFKEDLRYVVRLVEETKASKEAKVTAKDNIHVMDAVLSIYEHNGGV